MRIHLKIKSNNQIIPFDHQPLMVGTIHKWLGWNDLHGSTALFSFSRLEGAKPAKGGFKFERNTSFYISAHDIHVIKALINGIQTDPTLFSRLEVYELVIEEDPDLSQREYFQPGSPIFIKRKVDNHSIHYLFNDADANQLLKETLQTKMKVIGLEDDTLDIRFDLQYSNAGTKLITYDSIRNRANWCPVIIKGKPETKLFAWNVGLGNSTGIGFGAIK